ncbi:hypothetical protein AB0B45_44300 [Nonomuraea sp. NPDC049152]|uniref:hypothetical protein n=1 Tax=Nonomuraea sp. NPDC049152 TaxID=3154350 RepID=UPI0033CEB2DC
MCTRGARPANCRQVRIRMLAATVSAGEATEGLTKGSVMRYIAWPPEAGWTGERPERPGGCKLARDPPRP